MHLDVFRGDAFSLMNLTTAVNLYPQIPSMVGGMGLFKSKPVNDPRVAIEFREGKLTLVPTAARGAPGVNKTVERRKLRDFRCVHLPQMVSITADEVAGLRAFGKEAELETAKNFLNQKAQVARTDLEVTHEWQRVGAIRGNVVDADGTTVIYNYFTEFGVSQNTHTIDFTQSTTKVQKEIVAAKRKAKAALGGVMITGWVTLCSPDWMDAMAGHPALVEALKYQNSARLREDYRDGIDFGGVTWQEYDGTVGVTPLIPSKKAYLIPLGVPDLFETYFAPAPYMETVGTQGLPFYMKGEDRPFGTGIDYQLQSNPLHICTRPNAIVELTTP